MAADCTSGFDALASAPASAPVLSPTAPEKAVRIRRRILLISAIALSLAVAFCAFGTAIEGRDDFGPSDSQCIGVTPALLPPPSPPPPDGSAAYVAAWDAYVRAISQRPTGVQPGCMPMRFPARSSYRGVILVLHGFADCPQSMALLGPPLAAAGFDALFPLAFAHGDLLRSRPENSYWAVVMFSALAGSLVACVACCRCRCRCCLRPRTPRERRRRAQIAECAALGCVPFATSSLVAAAIVYFGASVGGGGGVVGCLSNPPPGLGFSCRGLAERNDRLPTSPDEYLAALDALNAIVALAPGEHAIVGLSFGGNSAAYLGQARRPDGSPLYARQLIIAPFIGLAGADLLLSSITALGLGNLVDQWGFNCYDERRAGRAGYCTMRVSAIVAARDVGQRLLAPGALRPAEGAAVSIVLIDGDDTVENAYVRELAAAYRTAGGGRVSKCMHYAGRAHHNLISVFNHIGVGASAGAPNKFWIRETVCAFTRFLADGVPLPTEAAQEGAGGHEPACAVECTPDACPFDCSRMEDVVVTSCS